MTYTNASYANPDNTTIRVDINGVTSFVPCAPGNSDYAAIQALVASGELTIAEYVPPPPPPVTQITMRQCRLELFDRGLLQQVQSIVDLQGGAVEIEWEYATIVDRQSPLVAALASNLTPPLTEEQVDELFQEASKR